MFLPAPASRSAATAGSPRTPRPSTNTGRRRRQHPRRDEPRPVHCVRSGSRQEPLGPGTWQFPTREASCPEIYGKLGASVSLVSKRPNDTRLMRRSAGAPATAEGGSSISSTSIGTPDSLAHRPTPGLRTPFRRIPLEGQQNQKRVPASAVLRPTKDERPWLRAQSSRRDEAILSLT